MLFGKEEQVTWRNDEATRTNSGKIGLRTAQIQHDVAYFVREERERKQHFTWEEVRVATGIEISTPVLSAIMRGESHMTMRHLAALDLVYGPMFFAGYRAQRLRTAARQGTATRPAGPAPRRHR